LFGQRFAVDSFVLGFMLLFLIFFSITASLTLVQFDENGRELYVWGAGIAYALGVFCIRVVL
jgi:hypothetical protein